MNAIMRSLHLILQPLLVLALCSAGVSRAADPPGTTQNQHPLSGTWSWTAFGGKCVETFQYRTTNTMLNTSGEAVSEWRYTVTPNANDKGFYELVETSVTSNGKKDCSGDTLQDSGVVNIRFVQFSPARDLILICREPSLAACFGPLRHKP